MDKPSGDVRLVPTATHWGAYTAEVRGGQFAAMRPFAADPDPSPIGQSIPGATGDALRIAQPMFRQGWLAHGPRRGANARGAEPFVAVPWDEALDRVAAELTRVKTAHGNAAIFAGSYGWASAGRFHHAQSQMRRFLNLFGGHAHAVNTYSTGAAEVIVPHVMGNFWDLTAKMNTWDQVAAHGELVVAFGGMALKNSQVHGGGFGRHVGREGQKKCVARGVKFVSLSAVKDDAADFLNAEWLTPRPGSDTAVMLGLAHTLVHETLHDEGFLARHCVGWERFRPYLMGEADGTPKDADWAAALSGLAADAIRALARRMARHRTLITVSWSLQRADHGEQPYWMAIALAAILGQIGLPGGGIGFGYGAANGIGAGGARIPPPSLPQGFNPVKAFIPVARIADMLENPGAPFAYNGDTLTYPDARLVYWCGGNPFHHHQDLARLQRAWQQPETIVVHEPWWNALARHADIVFPVATAMERNDIAGTSQDNHVLAMQQVVPPVGEARTDHAIFAALAERLGFAAAFTEGRSEMDWLALLYQRWQERAATVGAAMPPFDVFWEAGHCTLPERADPPPFLSEFRADPEAHPLKTPSGKIELFSATIAGFGYDDCPGHPVWHPPAEWLGAAAARRFPLHLISNQPRTRLHSQYDNGAVSQASKVQGREPVWINPRDAAARGIRAGDVVRLFNDRGACLAGAVVTDQVMPGVVQLATGAWYSPAPDAAPRAGRNSLITCVHGNPNVLTRDAGTSRIAQGSAAQTCLVEMERFAGELPPVEAMRPPRIVTR
jgi:biotin/methionine sulfoxide reductase